MEALKKLVIIGILLYAGYFALTHHFIFFGTKVKILKKIEPKITMDYTFFNVGPSRKDLEYMGIEKVLAIKPLRAAGLNELIVEMQYLTDEEKRAAEDRIDSGSGS
jgi:hypothetical protein